MNYKLLFDLQIHHEYFEPESSDDIVILPTKETSRLLKGRQCITKFIHSGLQVLIPSDDTSKMKVLFDKTDVMSFFIFPSSNDLTCYTDTTTLEEGEIFNFSNAKLNKSVQELEVSSTNEIQTHKGFPSVAKVDIHPTQHLLDDNQAPKRYTLSLKSTAVKWKYYFVATNGNKNLSVEDKQEKLVFAKKELETPTSDIIGQSLLSVYPRASILLFESNDPVPQTRLARKNLQLLRSGDVLIQNLPNPTVRDNGVKIINMKK